jgi:hypothetical protein
MTLTEILAEARNRLADTKTPYLWSDAEIIGYLNEAINQVVEKKRLIRDSKTAAVCAIAVLVADLTPDYLMDTRIVEIISAKMRSQSLPLTRTDKKELESWYPDWRAATASTSRYFLTDYSEGYLTIFPKSNAADTIDLTVYRLPSAQMSVSALTASPEIHFKNHPRLINGILSRAYLKEDSETLDPQKAATHLVLWTKDMDEMARARIRLHDAGGFLGPHKGAI